MRNMQQGDTWQLYPLVSTMERLNQEGCNYTLDIMVYSEVNIISYYDLRTDGTQVKGTLYNSNGVEQGGGVPYSLLNMDIAADMVIEFEHYVHVFEGIRCNFHKVSAEKEEAFYERHLQHC